MGPLGEGAGALQRRKNRYFFAEMGYNPEVTRYQVEVYGANIPLTWIVANALATIQVYTDLGYDV